MISIYRTVFRYRFLSIGHTGRYSIVTSKHNAICLQLNLFWLLLLLLFGTLSNFLFLADFSKSNLTLNQNVTYLALCIFLPIKNSWFFKLVQSPFMSFAVPAGKTETHILLSAIAINPGFPLLYPTISMFSFGISYLL